MTIKPTECDHELLGKVLPKIAPLYSRLPEYEIMPFCSLDIETTGTDCDQNQILQIAALWHSGKFGVERKDMPFLNVKIWYDPKKTQIVGNAFALTMEMNTKMLREMSKIGYYEIMDSCYHSHVDEKTGKKIYGKMKTIKEKRDGWVTIEVAASLLHQFLEECKEDCDSYYKALGERSQGITFGGKNFSGFDLPFLKAQFKGFNKISDFLSYKIKHRVQDLGAEYYPLFQFVPNLDDINKLVERTEVTHDALDDAYDCVVANMTIVRVVRSLINFYDQNKPN
jgi:DNA polymerase III epsilon subunit-like protein